MISFPSRQRTVRDGAQVFGVMEYIPVRHGKAGVPELATEQPGGERVSMGATEWLPIKPGTDLAFHLALLNVIITNKLYDAAFVAKNTLGFEELANSIGPYTPEWAAPLTGIDAATIDRIAREFAAAGRNAMAHPGWRTSNFVNSFQTERAIAILNTLVGNWGNTLIPVGGEGGGIPLGKPKQPPYPRITAQRLDGVPWKVSSGAVEAGRVPGNARCYPHR